jgi:phosphoribosylanthranilate isomerase
LEESLGQPASPVRVKICGITRLADAVAALEAGADYLGFILYPPSPRAVAPARVAQITTELRQHSALTGLFALPDRPLLVGVFVNEQAEDIARILDSCGLDIAQLSGDESPRIITDPASPLYGRAYKALRPRSIEEAISQTKNYTNLAPQSGLRLLVDTPHGKLYGGTGQTGDWVIAARLRSMFPGLMLAGGLKPENVAEAVATVRPFAVDVAGGVEAGPGVKDYDRVRAFIANAKSA